VILDKVRSILNKYNIKNCKILLAYSGGRDSSVLLDTISKLRDEYGLIIHISYINHNLRGTESHMEQAFVIEHLKQYTVFNHIRVISSRFWESNKDSIESKARKVRYDFFNRICRKFNIKWIFTAHHFDDKIETTIINILRGAGDETLSGIPEKRDNIIRPLISISRDEIDLYITENNIKFVDDSSNNTEIYLRNKIRHRLIEDLRIIQPHYRSSFHKFYELNDEKDQFIKRQICRGLKKSVLYRTSSYIIMDLHSLKLLDPYIVKRILKLCIKKLLPKTKFSKELFRFLSEIETLPDGKFYENKNYTIVIRSNRLWIFRKVYNSTILNSIEQSPFEHADFTVSIIGQLHNPYIYRDNLNSNMFILSDLPIAFRSSLPDDSINNNGKIQNITSILKANKIPTQAIFHFFTFISENRIVGFGSAFFSRIDKDYFISDVNKLGLPITHISFKNRKF